MVYRSRAAAIRQRRRKQRDELVGLVIQFGSIVLGGIAGIGLGIWILYLVLPDHTVLHRLGL